MLAKADECVRLLAPAATDPRVVAAAQSILRDHLAAQGSYRFYPQGPHLLLQSKEWQQVSQDILQWLPMTQQRPQENTENGLTGPTPTCEAC